MVDYGCGDGMLTEELFRRGIRAVDYYPDPDHTYRRLESPRGLPTREGTCSMVSCRKTPNLTPWSGT